MKTLKKLKPGQQIRHGDTFLQVVDALPADAVASKSNVVAEGEVTGHAHRLVSIARKPEDGFQMFTSPDGRLWLRTGPKGATLTHEEHEHVKLPSNTCFVCGIGPMGLGGRVQREWSPEGERQVVD